MPQEMPRKVSQRASASAIEMPGRSAMTPAGLSRSGCSESGQPGVAAIGHDDGGLVESEWQ